MSCSLVGATIWYINALSLLTYTYAFPRRIAAESPRPRARLQSGCLIKVLLAIGTVTTSLLLLARKPYGCQDNKQGSWAP